VIKILLHLAWNLKVFELSGMVLAEALRIPCLHITAITASSPSLLHHELMPLMIAIFEALQANNTGAINGTVKALNN
jgi:hypothetical protein